MLKTITNAAVLILVVWLLFVGFMYLTQDQQLYFPSGSVQLSPADANLAYDDLKLTTEDGEQLHAWYIPTEQTAAPLLLFFHGNAGNISHRLESLQIFHQLGLNVLIIDYRGYGNSTGTPSEAGLYKDAQAAWDWAVNESATPPEQIILFGRSLGASVAAHLAAHSEQPPAALMLEASFTSAQDLAAQLFPWVPVRSLMRAEYNTLAFLQENQAPVWIAHAKDDEIVPLSHANILYEHAASPKFFLPLEGGHNDGFIRTQPQYQQHIQDTLTSIGLINPSSKSRH